MMGDTSNREPAEFVFGGKAIESGRHTTASGGQMLSTLPWESGNSIRKLLFYLFFI